MKKNYKKIIIGIIIIILTVIYTYYVRPIVDDELYNYGFSFNIVEGLVPYKDFNMIIPPVGALIYSIPFLLFGSNLIFFNLPVSLIK